MVQGPHDLPEILKTAVAKTAAPAASASKQRPAPVKPSATTQAPDTVQLSPAAVQAAAQARNQPKAPAAAGPIHEAKAAASAAVTASAAPVERPALSQAPQRNTAPVAPVAAVKAVAPPAPVLSAAQVQALQATPEVRPDRVSEAQAKLATLSGDSGAMNAKLAEKLLTEN